MHLQDSASMGFMSSVCLQPFNLHRTDTAGGWEGGGVGAEFYFFFPSSSFLLLTAKEKCEKAHMWLGCIGCVECQNA